MTEKPWWRDPWGLPPGMRTPPPPLTPARIRLLRGLYVAAAVYLVAMTAAGYFARAFPGVLGLAAQPLLWWPEQRRQVFGRNSSA